MSCSKPGLHCPWEGALYKWIKAPLTLCLWRYIIELHLNLYFKKKFVEIYPQNGHFIFQERGLLLLQGQLPYRKRSCLLRHHRGVQHVVHRGSKYQLWRIGIRFRIFRSALNLSQVSLYFHLYGAMSVASEALFR